MEPNFVKIKSGDLIQSQILDISSLTYTCHFHYKGKPLVYTTVIHMPLTERGPLLCLGFSCQMEASDFCTSGHLMSSSVCSYWPNVASVLADVQRLQGHKRIKRSLLS